MLPFSYDDWMPVFTQVTTSTAGASAPRHSAVPAVCGLTWKTGETAPWNIPVETMYIPRCRRGTRCCSAALSRIIQCPTRTNERDVPGAFAEHHAGIHHWPTPATARGAVTCFTLPYDIPQPGNLTLYTYLGKCGSDFYFRADQCDDEYALVSQSVLPSARTAPGPTLALPKRRIATDYSAVLQGR